MKTLLLPALRSDDSLGFLAALGIVEILRSEVGIAESDIFLSWDGVGGPLKLTVPFESPEGLIDCLGEAAARMRAEDRLVPSRLPAIIPPLLSDAERQELAEQTGIEPAFDSIRMTRRESIARFALADPGSDTDLRWLCALVDQVSLWPQQEHAHVTPLYAPYARQRLRQLYDKTLTAVAADRGLIRDACLSWRRNPEDKGVNIDRRAQRDAVTTTTGDSRNAAVTGAEWLALQSAPWFRLGGSATRPFAWGWVAARPGGRPRALVWPVWGQPLDPVAVEVLITHPAVRSVVSGDRSFDGDLRALGVLAVLKAERATLGNSDGPLGPSVVVWPRRLRRAGA